MQHLDKLGYNDGPPESAEFGVVDGEEIEIKVEHNLCLEGYRNSSLKIKFYKHLPFDRYQVDHHCIPVYQGVARYQLHFRILHILWWRHVGLRAFGDILQKCLWRNSSLPESQLPYKYPPGRLSVPRQGKLVLYVPKVNYLMYIHRNYGSVQCFVSEWKQIFRSLCKIVRSSVILLLPLFPH
jgi:hypothetical protein